MKALILGSSILVLLIGALVFGGWVQMAGYLSSPGPSTEERTVVVPRDADARQVVDILEREGLINRPEWLRFYVDRLAKPIEVKPGEYAFTPAMSPIEFIQKLTSGKVVTYPITIPAGATAAEIVDQLSKARLADPAQLASLIEDARVAQELGVPGVSLEGFLFPDTYEIPRGLEPKALLGLLVGRYKRFVTLGVLDTARVNGLDERALITLASLIQKSDVPESEQRLFSALLHNRLAQEKPLEVRASLEYGLAKKGLTIESADPADLKTRWNLDENPGLPPGPIASPSLAAILAAAEPAKSKVISMVRRPSGDHVFCADEACEAAALKEWAPDRLKEKKRR